MAGMLAKSSELVEAVRQALGLRPGETLEGFVRRVAAADVTRSAGPASTPADLEDDPLLPQSLRETRALKRLAIKLRGPGEVLRGGLPESINLL